MIAGTRLSECNFIYDRVLLILLIYLMIGTTFPFFTQITSIPSFYPSFALITVYLLIKYTSYIINLTVGISLIFFILSCFYYFSGIYVFYYTVDFNSLFLGYFAPYFIASIVLNIFIRNSASDIIFNKLGNLLIWIILLNSILTIASEIFFPGITRVGTSSFGQGRKLFQLSLSFTIVNVLPFIIYAMLNVKNKDFKIYLAIVTSIFTIIITGYMIAIFITVLVVWAYVLRKFKLNLFFSILLFFVLATSFYTFVIFALELFEATGNPIFEYKINELSDLGTYTDNIFDTFLSFRSGVYGESIDIFLLNIMFGSGNWNSVGGHSLWLDFLGFGGILYAAVFFFVIFYLFKITRNIIPAVYKLSYLNNFIFVNIFLFLNPGADIYFIFFLYIGIPVIYNYYYQKSLQKVKNE